jgi:photosystem II cytochrome c550
MLEHSTAPKQMVQTTLYKTSLNTRRSNTRWSLVKKVAQKISRTVLLTLVLTSWLWLSLGAPAQAAVDDYITRYLKVGEPIELPVDAQGNARLFSAIDLTEGKRLFENNCKNCHVGGATLPNPRESLSLKTLAGATPPRTNINALVDFQRLPMEYDGSEPSVWCRQVSENWLTTPQLENLAAFILRAAEKAPGWGTENLEDFQ